MARSMDSFVFSSFFTGIAKTLHILMLCLALSWILTRLPFALRFSADCLRNPLFVFALSNAIIAALIVQSARGTTTQSEEEVVEYHNKHITDDTCAHDDSSAVADSDSEWLKDGNDTERQKLRRSERENMYPHDELSNEEFQRTIEAFIAKQMRFLREESLPIFVHPAAAAAEQTNLAKSLNNHTTCSC